MHTLTNKLKLEVDRLKRKGLNTEVVKTILKESLQDHILNAIYSHSKYKNMIFIGGTALRKLYELPRYSEDLDFTTKEEIDYNDLGEMILKYFKNLDFSYVDFSIQESDLVKRLIFKFEILKDLELSNHENEKLHVKVETTLTNKEYETILTPLTLSNMPMIIKSYELETLFAGKLLACLYRIYKKGDTGIYVKGRDYYDLLWYMEKDIKPNLQKLLDTNPLYTIQYVFKELDKKTKIIKKEDLYTDLEHFFEEQEYIKIWCKNFHEIYKRLRKKY